jgi:plasmid stabilization system protein ParE
MTSNIELQFTDEAENNIDDILQYTNDTWGDAQEARYRETLRQAFLSIREFPELGRRTSAPREREYVLPHHTIVYRYEGRTVTILRIKNPRQRRR